MSHDGGTCDFCMCWNGFDTGALILSFYAAVTCCVAATELILFGATVSLQILGCMHSILYVHISMDVPGQHRLSLSSNMLA